MITQTETPPEPWYPDTAYEAAEWIKNCLLSGAPLDSLERELWTLIDLAIEEGEQ